jgi:polynucleotide 5'-hydroxyl-kinase GRC3/NOL9
MIPLVVNMMGWTKGMGADLSRKVLELLEPSVVFDFEAPVVRNGSTTSRTMEYSDLSPPFDTTTNGSIYRHLLEAILPSTMSQRYSPADQRTLSLLSYFHAIFPSPASSAFPPHFRSVYANSWDTSLPLCAQPPYELTASEALDAVILSSPGSEDVVPSEVHRVLNGAVAGLVSYEPGSLNTNHQAHASNGIPYAQGMPPPPPASSTCHGLALVRSLSASSPAQLHILTPLPPACLSTTQPRVLVKGEMELPVWGMLDFRSEDAVAGVERSKVPFLRWGKTEGTGGEKRRVRRNLMRRGQQ